MWEKCEGKFHISALESQQQREPRHTRHTFGVGLRWFCDVVENQRGPQWASEREKWSTDSLLDGVPHSSAARCGRMVSPHQHQSIISTSCRGPEGALQLWAIPQLWQNLITGTLHTLVVSHWNMTTSFWCIFESVGLCLSDAQEAISFLVASQHLSTPMAYCPRALFFFPLQTLDIDYLALVDPVDIKTFWIHLHGDRNSLCRVLDGDEGISVDIYWV